MITFKFVHFQVVEEGALSVASKKTIGNNTVFRTAINISTIFTKKVKNEKNESRRSPDLFTSR